MLEENETLLTLDEESLRKIDQVDLFHPVDHILQVARNLPFNYNE